MDSLVSFVNTHTSATDNVRLSVNSDSGAFETKDKPAWLTMAIATKKNSFNQAQQAVKQAIESVKDPEIKSTLTAIYDAKMSSKDMLGITHHKNSLTMEALRSITAAYEGLTASESQADATLQKAINESKVSFSQYVEDHDNDAMSYRECIGRLKNTCQMIDFKMEEINITDSNASRNTTMKEKRAKPSMLLPFTNEEMRTSTNFRHFPISVLLCSQKPINTRTADANKVSEPSINSLELVSHCIKRSMKKNPLAPTSKAKIHPA